MSYLPKLKNIKAFVFDVDGVFTDGSVYLLPDRNMSRVMSVLDGYAVVQCLKQGYKIGIITGGNDPMVQNRMNILASKIIMRSLPTKFPTMKISNPNIICKILRF